MNRSPKTPPSHAAGSESGLTLVEIVVVLIILGVLMSWIGSKIVGAGDKARVDMTTLKMKELKTYIEQYHLRNNHLPQSLAALACAGEAADCVPITAEDNLKDAWGNSFAYAIEGGRSYAIKSLGADGRDGGTGVDFDLTTKGP